MKKLKSLKLIQKLKGRNIDICLFLIKALTNYCGFQWRAKTPSGALSIQWYNEYGKTGDETILNRILEYNEDDCKATMVVKDKIASLNTEKL